ncbi:MAG: cytochrome P450 [Chloroflexota bacterium]
MVAIPQQQTLTDVEIKHKINIGNQHFIDNKQAYYRYLLEEAPVYQGKVSVLPAYLVSRYDDCLLVLKDSRFVRNRATATGGGGRLPFPMPKSVQLMAQSMIIEDDPEHRRLRNLVHKAFTPRSIVAIEKRVEQLTHELLDKAEAQGTVDLMDAYALPIPVTVIREMVGVPEDWMPRFRDSMQVLTKGLSGWSLFRTLFFDLRQSVSFMRELIAYKKTNPADDILTGLIQAEEAGETLTEDELVSLVFLLIVAGYETTVHLITNSVLTLLQHPQELDKLCQNMDLMPSAVEEILRYAGPINSTKPQYATEDIELHGVTIPQGKTVFPLLGAANRDPRQFENPHVFDIERTPNKHLGFGQGIHYCLGAPLARMETKIALTTLLNRNPNLKLAVDANQLKVTKIPGWHRYESLPVTFG